MYRVVEIRISNKWEPGKPFKKITCEHSCKDLEKHRRMIAQKQNCDISQVRFTYEEEDSTDSLG